MDNKDLISGNERIRMLKHTMDRYDQYYNSVNNKGYLFISLNTFLLGGIITGYFSIRNEVVIDFFFLLMVCLGLIFCLLSIGFSLSAIIPYLGKKYENGHISAIYFENVANISLQEFKKKYDEMTSGLQYDDYLKQTHTLALGLKKKFRRLRTATLLLSGCFFCIIIIGVNILI